MEGCYWYITEENTKTNEINRIFPHTYFETYKKLSNELNKIIEEKTKNIYYREILDDERETLPFEGLCYARVLKQADTYIIYRANRAYLIIK